MDSMKLVTKLFFYLTDDYNNMESKYITFGNNIMRTVYLKNFPPIEMRHK